MPEAGSAVLVGRTNVGKSSLFNRLVGRSRAIVSHEAGTTRDVNRALAQWRGEQFWLTDTGGFDIGRDDPAARATARQLERAAGSARVLLFVIDAQFGLTPADRAYARHLRQLPGHAILVVNKVDGARTEADVAGLSLGFRDVVLTSAKTGRGLGDLLDLVARHLAPGYQPEPSWRIGLFGQTNVGKSSLFNRLVGSERSIVLPSPHTTRDRVHEFLTHSGATLEIVDTAGLRRQHLKAPRLEQQGAEQAHHALEEIDVALLIIDGSQAPVWQDQRLGDLIAEARVAAVVIANKADLVPEEERKAALKKIGYALPMVAWAPVLWVSALKGTGCAKVLPEAQAAAAAWRRQLTPAELQRFWIHLKRARTLRELALVRFEQVNTKPPRFTLTIRRKENMPRAVGPWVEGQLRERFKFQGSPISVRAEGVRGNQVLS